MCLISDSVSTSYTIKEDSAHSDELCAPNPKVIEPYVFLKSEGKQTGLVKYWFGHRN